MFLRSAIQVASVLWCWLNQYTSTMSINVYINLCVYVWVGTFSLFQTHLIWTHFQVNGGGVKKQYGINPLLICGSTPAYCSSWSARIVLLMVSLNLVSDTLTDTPLTLYHWPNGQLRINNSDKCEHRDISHMITKLLKLLKKKAIILYFS